MAHATMEPMNCTVHIRKDSAEAWVPTQGPQWALDITAGVSVGLRTGGRGAAAVGRGIKAAAHGVKVAGQSLVRSVYGG